MSYERLLQEYDEIERLAGSLSCLIGQSTADVGEVSASLTTLGIAIDEHLTFQHTSIVAAATRINHTNSQPKALDRFCLQTLQAEWHQHLADWIGQVIETEWLTFQQETSSMLSRLTEYMRREAEQLYPLALQHCLVRLRDSSPRQLGPHTGPADHQRSASRLVGQPTLSRT